MPDAILNLTGDFLLRLLEQSNVNSIFDFVTLTLQCVHNLTYWRLFVAITGTEQRKFNI